MHWFVSRHQGAVEWLARKGVVVDRQVAHLDLAQVQAGDWVLGSLPVNMAAAVCARGAQYLHLSLALPAHARGARTDGRRAGCLRGAPASLCGAGR